jgi:hypothetical protein
MNVPIHRIRNATPSVVCNFRRCFTPLNIMIGSTTADGIAKQRCTRKAARCSSVNVVLTSVPNRSSNSKPTTVVMVRMKNSVFSLPCSFCRPVAMAQMATARITLTSATSTLSVRMIVGPLSMKFNLEPFVLLL